MKKIFLVKILFFIFISNIKSQDWTWKQGADTAFPKMNVYPTEPGSRKGAVTWKDNQGNLWLFGGSDVYNSVYTNNLWKYNPTTNKWIWMKGSSSNMQYGVYGTLGVAANSNVPGARMHATGWTDSNGDLWLFGGEGNGLPTANASGLLNDLWKYHPATNQWTWMGGDSNNSLPNYAIYGTMGVAAPTNKPGHVRQMCSWVDANDNVWLFGGYGYNAWGLGVLEDLWKYDPATAQWTWMKGSGNTGAQPIHNTINVPSPTNAPGGRMSPSGWIDANGNLYLFGGELWTTSMNDLWKYDPLTNNWVWIKGSNIGYQVGTFGTQGISAPANTPGAKTAAVTWKDNNNNFWLFGGFGTTSSSNYTFTNDLWKYNPSTNEWTWMKGAIGGNQNGIYNAKGIPNPLNSPGSRSMSNGWSDANGNIWLFGGLGLGASGNIDLLNDLWKYNIATNTWIWTTGSNSTVDPGFFGVQGATPTPCYPAARDGAAMWTKPNGEIWLFGGNANNPNFYSDMNDLWKYDPVINEWSFIKGSHNGGNNQVVGTVGVPHVDNNPEAVAGSSARWMDTQGNLWIYSFDNNNIIEGGVWKYTISTNEWTCMNHGGGPVYGTIGVPSTTNCPGARHDAITVTDSFGKTWLFGGMLRNDLWKYDPTNNTWTWMTGSTGQAAQGIYGSLGFSAPGNTPGARQDHHGWIDANNNIWIFGGLGIDMNPQSMPNAAGELNDLWKYNPTTNEWAWMSGGNNYIFMTSFYGTQGVPSASTTPGTRRFGATWYNNNELFLLGGHMSISTGGPFTNDLWKFNINTNQWTWIKGSNINEQAGIYGTMGQSAPLNTPGSRNLAAFCKRANGNLLLFGGNGYGKTNAFGTQSSLNDLWEFAVCTAPSSPVNTTSASNLNFCSGIASTLSATSIYTINWYASLTSTISLGSGSSYTTPTLSAGTYTYYAGVKDNACNLASARTPFVVTVNLCTGVQSQFNTTNYLSVYPNPSTGIFTIEASQVVKIFVYDQLGKQIFESELNSGKQQIDLSKYDNGLYLVKAINGSYSKILKINKSN